MAARARSPRSLSSRTPQQPSRSGTQRSPSGSSTALRSPPAWRSERTGVDPCAGRPPASRPMVRPIGRPPSPSTSATSGRTRTARRNSIRRPVPSPWCRCPDRVRAWCWWSIRGEAARIGALAESELAGEIERRSHSILGRMEPEPGRGAFPLAIETARRFAVARMALVGEAAHLLPPIGAQGLNLGLRDAATIAELVVATHRNGGDVGAPDLADRYDGVAAHGRGQPQPGGRPAQSQPAVGFPADAGRAGLEPFSPGSASARCAVPSCARGSRRAPRSRA